MGHADGQDRIATSRELFFFERFLRAGGYRPWNVLLIARVCGTIDESALHQALAGLQSHHPILAAHIVDCARAPRFETLEPIQPIALRIVDRTGPDDWFIETLLELERRFDSASGPLLRAVWVRSEATSELILIADHCITDGRSLLMLMRELVDRLDPARPRRPALRQIGSVAQLFADPPSRATISRQPVFSLNRLAQPMRLASAIGRVLRRPAPISPSYVLRWELAAPVGDVLRQRARDESATSYSALATAFSRAIRAVRPTQSHNRLLCPVDVRSWMPGLEPGALSAFPDTMRLSLDRRLDDAFWSQARVLRHGMIAARARLHPQRKLVGAERMHALSDWFITLQLHGRARNDFMFSHLGATDFPEGPGRLQVDSVLGFLSSMPWRRTPAIFSAQERGTIRFFLVAREEALPRVQAEQVRDRAMATIAAALA